MISLFLRKSNVQKLQLEKYQYLLREISIRGRGKDRWMLTRSMTSSYSTTGGPGDTKALILWGGVEATGPLVVDPPTRIE